MLAHMPRVSGPGGLATSHLFVCAPRPLGVAGAPVWAAVLLLRVF